MLDLSDVEDDPAIFNWLPSFVPNHKAVFQNVDDRPVASQQRKLVVSEASKLMQGALGNLAMSGLNIQVVRTNVQQFFAIVITKHAHQCVVHLEKPAIRRRKVRPFLDVVEQLAIQALSPGA